MADTDFIGINWGSSNFRAYRISAAGQLVDERQMNAGIGKLDREGMVATVASALTGWEDAPCRYAAGMVGSNIGWAEATYANCPASAAALAAALLPVTIGAHSINIVPGLTCRRADGAPDILRGEEIEFLGALALCSADAPPRHIIMPGTHSKWGRIADGALQEFFTAMSGELYDRMTAAGLLASVIDGEAEVGPVFARGVAAALNGGTGLATAMFGARAMVIRGDLPRTDAASYLRGLLIGAELRDAMAMFPDICSAAVPLVGNAAMCLLYADALASLGGSTAIIDARMAGVAGFTALHHARQG